MHHVPYHIFSYLNVMQIEGKLNKPTCTMKGGDIMKDNERLMELVSRSTTRSKRQKQIKQCALQILSGFTPTSSELIEEACELITSAHLQLITTDAVAKYLAAVECGHLTYSERSSMENTLHFMQSTADGGQYESSNCNR